MKPITISFPIDRKKVHRDNEVLTNCELLDRLRSAGIPAVGNISLQGVERGTLSIETDRTFGDYIYTWTPPEDDDDDPAAGL